MIDYIVFCIRFRLQISLQIFRNVAPVWVWGVAVWNRPTPVSWPDGVRGA